MKREYLLNNKIKPPKKDGKRIWYYKLKNGGWKSTGETTRAKAESFVLALLQDTEQKSQTTLNQYAKTFYVWEKCPWIKRQHAKGRSFSQGHAQERRRHLEMYILPKFGKMPMSEINPVMYENWLIGLQRVVEEDGTLKQTDTDLSASTKNQITYSLSLILKEARREGILKYNPLADVEPIRAATPGKEILTGDEIKMLFPSEQQELVNIWGSMYWATFFFLLLSTGMRTGEARALTWKNVIWDLHGILILHAINKGEILGPPKSGEPRSTLIPKRTETFLKIWRDVSEFPEDDDFIFYGFGKTGKHEPVRGTWINRSTPLNTFKRCIKKAGIERNGLTVHSLRHTNNTIMLSQLTKDALHYQIGHKSDAMTDHYDQSTPTDRLLQLAPNRKIIDKIW